MAAAYNKAILTILGGEICVLPASAAMAILRECSFG